MDPNKPVSDEDLIEAISEWPVVDSTGEMYSSSTDKIHNPTSVSSFFLRNISRPKKQIAKPPDITDSVEVLADVALARWWRRTGKELFDPESLPKSQDPNTVINFAVGTDEGLQFLKDEVSRLRDKISHGSNNANTSCALSSFYEKLGNLSLAKLHLETAVDKDPQEKTFQWRLERLNKAIQFRQLQEEALSKLDHNSESQLVLPMTKQVERVAATELSTSDFFFKYALTSTPVVITGLVNNMTSVPWTLQHISDIAGECQVMLKKHVKESVQWARLEDCQNVKVKDFISSLQSSDHTLGDKEKLYLFDWSLPTYCPRLASELTIPKYFAGDFLQRTTEGTLYKDSWPSLFIAPAGIASDLHIDAFGSNFWMALFEGKKRWVFYDKSHTPMLYPVYGHPFSTDPVFQVNLEDPDVKMYPLLSLAQPTECILQPGEALFVPAACPHRVENLETSLAISGNFVDLSNFDLVKAELKVNSLIDERSSDLLKQLSNSDFKSNMCSDIDHLSWVEFKTWPPKFYDQFDVTQENVQLRQEVLLNKR